MLIYVILAASVVIVVFATWRHVVSRLGNAPLSRDREQRRTDEGANGSK
jgi:hypothetical protein